MCREWADAHGVAVAEQHVFTDRAKSGRTFKREGLQAMLTALENDEIDVVICFATNRLYRKVYKALQTVEEEIVDRRKRCVFVMQKIDTDDKQFWRQLMSFSALIDEWQSQMSVDFIRSAHEGLLLDEKVHGTRSFGYRGVEVEGRRTRRGKARRRWDICAIESPWVRKMFAWFTAGRLTMSAIARRLNNEGAPPPPKSPKGRWGPGAVKVALSNRRYIGDWSYGWTETIFQNKAGYGRQFKRDVPRRHHEIPRLRLIDDATFHGAQALRARYEGKGGRPRGSGPHDTGPDPLHELLWCPQHERFLIAMTDKVMMCPDCKLDSTRPLFSMLNRRLALRIICTKLSELIQVDPDIVTRAIAECRRVVDCEQQPDHTEMAQLRRRLDSVTSDIQFIMNAPGRSETDRSENCKRLAELRAERFDVERQLSEIAAAHARPRKIPTEPEVRETLKNCAEILEGAATSGSVEIQAAACRIIHDITGGRITMSQQGERMPKRGYLRGTFRLNRLRPVLDNLGVPPLGTHGTEPIIELDFREPTDAERLADEVKELKDAGMLDNQIARELDRRYPKRPRPFSRAVVRKALGHWYARHGRQVPDRRRRRA